MERAKSKTLIFILTLIAISHISACDFFGRKKEEDTPRPVGILGDGKSIIGTYSYSAANTSADRNPKIAQTAVYSFDPNSGARIEVTDPHLGSIKCSAFGQYRIQGEREVFIYIQAVQPENCGFAPVVHLADVEVLAQSLKYTEPSNGQRYSMFANRAPVQAPTGLWDFRGTGGIDYLFLDTQGYFILQSTDTETEEKFLLLGFYTVSQGSLSLTFFSNMDPTQVSGSPIVFSSFATDGDILQLLQKSSTGDLLYNGYRL